MPLSFHSYLVPHPFILSLCVLGICAKPPCGMAVQNLSPFAAAWAKFSQRRLFRLHPPQHCQRGGAPGANRRIDCHKIPHEYARGGSLPINRRAFSPTSAAVSPTPPTLTNTVILNRQNPIVLAFTGILATGNWKLTTPESLSEFQAHFSPA
jgi:hypothetical protein